MSSTKRYAHAHSDKLQVPDEPNGTLGIVRGRSDHDDGEDQFDLEWTNRRGLLQRQWFTLAAIKHANPQIG